ncbi:50S ribosomal protein L20 [Patescibacteria group bacterium]|nr:50S ribosomal protein L20 [Patescibacteria group bacterium]MBU1682875.1 50S ribosomal protein L20 [Patescibacteria group bacterium]
MSRVKRGVTTHRRHKKILQMAKGFRGKRKNVFKLAKNAVMKAGTNAYRDRRLKKRTFHQLWVLRINAACREHDMKYSRFIYALELAGIQINRKMLAELAVNNPDVFKEIVDAAKAALPPEGQAPDLNELKKKFGKATKPKPKMPEESPYVKKVENGENKEKEEKTEKAEIKPTPKKAAKKKEEK